MRLIRIDRWDVRRDGPLSQAALEQKVRALGYEPTLRTYPAGAISAAHADAREWVEAVVSGLVKVTLDGETAILTAGDIVFIPRGGARRLEVVGTSPAYCLEAISTEHAS
jgi:quercetin dioxygenase-like cupin family protein